MLFGPLTIAVIINRAIVLLIAMTVHEFAHAYVAFRMGDTTARDMGKMTLDPRANINPIGFLMGVLLGFGILGSAPVNPYRMRDSRWGLFYAVAAGPISNLILAVICAIPFRLGLVSVESAIFRPGTVIPTLSDIMFLMVYMNLLLFLFNLIPLAPLDGWTVMLKLVPPDLSRTLQAYTRESMYLLYGIIFIGFFIPALNFFGIVLLPPLYSLLHLLTGSTLF